MCSKSNFLKHPIYLVNILKFYKLNILALVVYSKLESGDLNKIPHAR